VGVVVGLLMALASAVLPGLDTGASTLPEPSPGPSSTAPGPSAAASPLSPGPSPGGSPASPGPSPTNDAAAQLSQLSVAPEGPREGYARTAFKHWVDADGDGCDTREEVLIEESVVPATVGSGCSITAGAWFSPYDASTFVAPGGLDIDHVVPLGEAWDSGASEWDSSQRQDYANDLNDPEALIAVSASSNRSKGDSDPAEWKPPNETYWCRYASDWVTVKARWDLSADPAEVHALQQMLATCGAIPG
jgi:hypothetical protein